LLARLTEEAGKRPSSAQTVRTAVSHQRAVVRVVGLGMSAVDGDSHAWSGIRIIGGDQSGPGAYERLAAGEVGVCCAQSARA